MSVVPKKKTESPNALLFQEGNNILPANRTDLRDEGTLPVLSLC